MYSINQTLKNLLYTNRFGSLNFGSYIYDMSENNKNTTNGSLGFLSILTLMLIFLKLAEIGEVATWSWYWVLSPVWIPIVLSFSVIVVIYIVLWFNSKK